MKLMSKKTNRPKHQIVVQRAYRSEGQPDRKQIKNWVNAALTEINGVQQCVLRIVDELESAELNRQYRGKQGPTNILSFPFEWPEEIVEQESGPHYLGDLVVCAPVIEQEALDQRKSLENHWAHIIVHGVLHLLGYDHLDDDEAGRMENKEIEILAHMNIDNPYLEALHT